MKISNTLLALRKIHERDEWVKRLKKINDQKHRLFLSDNEYGGAQHDVTDFVDIDSIMAVVREKYNTKISELNLELKELGVYVDDPNYETPGLMMRF
jgi:hypothetical protein